MKQRFFIFVQCAPGKTHDVGLAIAKSEINGVIEINSVSGKWDILLRVEIDNREDVSKRVIDPLQLIDGVKRTKTIVGYSIINPDDVFF